MFLKTKYFSLLMIFLSNQAISDELLIDINTIAGKTKQQVSNLMGNPTLCTPSKYGEKCLFKKQKTEIVFIKEKADWITVKDLENYRFSNEALKAIGLKPEFPTFSNDFSKRWESINGLLSVSLFKGDSDKVEYLYIKVFTK